MFSEGGLSTVGRPIVLQLMLCAAALWLASGTVAARADDEAKALAAIKRVGGRISREADRPGKSVVQVSLYCRDLSGFDLKALAALKSLTSLSLAWSTAADAELKSVASLTGLSSLDLHSTGVTDEGVKELSALTGLTSLNLNYTGVTDASLKELAALKNLSLLKLKDTKVTDVGVKELQKALPKCRVEK
jgi:hypothetical protein